MKLKGKPDGSFLVRDSSDPRYILSLSFRSQGITHHTRMEHYRGKSCRRFWGCCWQLRTVPGDHQPDLSVPNSALGTELAEEGEQQQRVLSLVLRFCKRP